MKTFEKIRRYFFRNCIVCLQPAQQQLAICDCCFKLLPWLNNFCGICSLPLSKGKYLCHECIANGLEQPYRKIHAVFKYSWPLSQWILQFKFSGKCYFADVLAELLYQHILQWYEYENLPDCIIPVPLSHRRYVKRGYNQCDEIAKIISKKLPINTLNNTCKRKTHKRAQAQLSWHKRLKNMEDVFCCRRTVKNKHVVILDDVVTTQATITSLTKELKKAGAIKIDVWTLCRVNSVRTTYKKPLNLHDK